MSTITCPNCGYIDTLFGSFCSKCGQALTVSCSVCGEGNIYDAVYCRSCGVQLAAAPTGLFLPRAWAWREQFRSLGWWQPSSIDEDRRKRLIDKGLPKDLNSVHEPWIMICPVDGQMMMPQNISVNNKTIAQKYLGSRVNGFLVATRCKLAVAAEEDSKDQVWWYQDLSSYNWQGNGNVEIQAKNTDTIGWRLHVPKAGLMDYTVALAGSDAFYKGFAHSTIQAKLTAQKGFMEIIGEFLHDIVTRVNQ